MHDALRGHHALSRHDDDTSDRGDPRRVDAGQRSLQLDGVFLIRCAYSISDVFIFPLSFRAILDVEREPLICNFVSEGRVTSGGNAADDSATAAAADGGHEEDGPPPALPPRPPNLALPAAAAAAQSAMSTSPATATSSIATSSVDAAAVASSSQHPPHIANSYSRRLGEGTANNRAGKSSIKFPMSKCHTWLSLKYILTVCRRGVCRKEDVADAEREVSHPLL